MQNSFASDGYIWADQEQRYTQDFGGYVSISLLSIFTFMHISSCALKLYAL